MRKLKFMIATLLLIGGIFLFGCSNEDSSDEITYETATVEDVKNALEDDSSVVIDTRFNEAYSGWAVGDNKLGGHIDGSTDFSANLLTATFDDKDNLDAMTREEHLEKYMDDKNISTDSSLILYDENGKDALEVAKYFSSKGIEDIKVFDLDDWDEDLVSYENYQLYLPAVVVNDLIEGKEVEEIGEVSDLKILEVSWGSEEESGYLDGHIPTAIHVNSDDFDDEDNYYLLESDEILFELAKSLGITTDSTVVCTGNPIFSARYATILKYLGVENVYVMSGGTTSWEDSGFTLEKDSNKGVAVDDFGTDIVKNPDIIDTVAEVEAKLSAADFILVDIRTEEEYRGETSGYSYYDIAGRIEGAIYGSSGVDNSSSMLFYDNLDTTMRNGYEILSMWEELGIDTNKHLSFYCGGGYRAAEVYWDTLVLGMDNTSLFADGWIGWAEAGLDYVTGE